MLRLVVRYFLVIASLAVVSALTISSKVAVAVFAGAALSGVNFASLIWLLQRILAESSASSGPSKVVCALLLGMKFVILLGAIWLLVAVADVHLLGLALGFGTLFLAIAAVGVHQGLFGAKTTPAE